MLPVDIISAVFEYAGICPLVISKSWTIGYQQSALWRNLGNRYGTITYGMFSILWSLEYNSWFHTKIPDLVRIVRWMAILPNTLVRPLSQAASRYRKLFRAVLKFPNIIEQLFYDAIQLQQAESLAKIVKIKISPRVALVGFGMCRNYPRMLPIIMPLYNSTWPYEQILRIASREPGVFHEIVAGGFPISKDFFHWLLSANVDADMIMIALKYRTWDLDLFDVFAAKDYRELLIPCFEEPALIALNASEWVLFTQYRKPGLIHIQHIVNCLNLDFLNHLMADSEGQEVLRTSREEILDSAQVRHRYNYAMMMLKFYKPLARELIANALKKPVSLGYYQACADYLTGDEKREFLQYMLPLADKYIQRMLNYTREQSSPGLPGSALVSPD